jgi:hypothetical protein
MTVVQRLSLLWETVLQPSRMSRWATWLAGRAQLGARECPCVNCDTSMVRKLGYKIIDSVYSKKLFQTASPLRTDLLLIVIPTTRSEQSHEVVNTKFVVFHLISAQSSLRQLPLLFLELKRTYRYQTGRRNYWTTGHTRRIRSSTVFSMVSLKILTSRV